MEYLCLFLFAFLSITVIGHGIWVFFAWMLRSLFDVAPATRAAEAEECPRCSRLRPPWRRQCEWCGLQADSLLARELADLAASYRQLKRLLDAGTLTQEAHQNLLTLMRERHDTLLGRAPAKPAPAAPVMQAIETEELLSVLPVDEVPPIPAVPAPALLAEASNLLAPVQPPLDLPEAQIIETPAPAPLVPVLQASASVEPAPASAAPAPPSAPILDALPVAAAPRPPRRSMLELLSAFMEQSNILWGELVGGLLIVVCSIALVISLWPKLEENPAYQFMIFVSVTAMLFGAGLYTFHHWKLESTSRGLLVIATLLVPLNFLAIAAQTRGISGPLELTLELISLAGFAALLFFTGRVLVPDGRFWFPIAVLGASASQLLVPKVVGQAGSGIPLAALAGLPVFCHLIGCIGGIRRALRHGALSAAHAGELFVLLGTSTFAIGAALGLLVSWSVFQGGDVWNALAHVSIAMSLAALPLLAGGVLMQRHLAEPGDAASPESAHLGGLRTAATATALVGMFAMLVAVGLAWTLSPAVLLVCGLNFSVLTYLAFRQGMPFAHGSAIPCLAVGYLTGIQLLMGGEIAGALLTAENGAALVLLVLVLGAIGELLDRWKKREHAIYYAGGAGVLALASLLLITLPDVGIQAPLRAMVIFAIYGVAGLIFNTRWRSPLLTSCSLALLAASSLWGLWWNDLDLPAQRVPLWSAVLAGEGLVLVLLALFTRRFQSAAWDEAYGEPAIRTAEGMAPLALLAAFWSGIAALSWDGSYVVAGGCLSTVFLLLAAFERRPALARVAGIGLIGTAIATTGWVADLQEAMPLQELSLVAFGLALAGVAMSLTAAVADRRRDAASRFATLAALRGPAAGSAILAALIAAGSLALGQTALTTATAGLLALTLFLLAWEYERATLAWIGSALALAAFANEYSRQLPLPTPWPTLAFLGHATLGLLVASALKRWRPSEESLTSKRFRLLEQPLDHSSFLTSILSLGVVVHLGWNTVQTSSLCLLWLAGLWLVRAWMEKRPGLFAAFQAVLAVAVVGFAASSLTGQEWFNHHPWGTTGRLLDPWSLHTFGWSLAALSLAWMVGRLLLRSQPEAQRLLEPAWPAVDRVVLGGLAIAQLVVPALSLYPELHREINALAPLSDTVSPHAFGSGAWLLLAMLAGVLGVGLWERRAAACVVGTTLLALTMPVLVAGNFTSANASGLALRWGLGLTLVAVSLPIWFRDRVHAQALRWKCNLEDNPSLPSLVRATLLGGTAIPILCLTLELASAVLAGVHPLAPAEDSLFFALGQTFANVVPLVLVGLVLVGHAVRERSSGYAFKAGLVVNLAVVVGHAIGFVKAHRPLDWSLAVQLQIQLLQLAALAASVWALLWIAVRRKWYAERTAPLLLSVQLALGAIGVVIVLAVATGDLVAALPPVVPIWPLEAGTWLGWVSLIAAVAAAAAFLREQKKPLPTLALGFVGMAFIAQIACTVGASVPAWGYRTLLLGCGIYPVVLVLTAWRRSLQMALEKNALDAVTVWVGVAGTAAVLLGLKAAIVHDDHYWAALAIAFACPAAAAVGVWRRHEPWAFAAGLGVNLAASLVVWGRHQADPLGDWWALLFQANTIASSGVALLWLALRDRLYETEERRLGGGPLLAVQVCLGLAGNALLFLAAAPIVLVPGERLWSVLAHVGDTWGWSAWLLALAGAGWYALRAWGRYRGGLAGVLTLGVGILAACAMSHRDDGHWQAYHTLLAFTAIATCAALMEATALRRITLPGVRTSDVPVLIIAGITLLLAVRGTWEDPALPYWSAGVTLAVSLAVGLLAVQSRVPGQVFLSGLLLNLAGFIGWAAWGDGGVDSFFHTQALCFGLATGAWAALARALDRPAEEAAFRLTWPALVQPFTHLGSLLGLCTLAGLTAAGVFWSLTQLREPTGGVLAWWALGAVTLPFVFRLREAKAWLAREGLYVLGLAAIGITLNGAGLSARSYLWNAGLALAPYMAATACLAWTFTRNPRFADALGIRSSEVEGQARSWFASADTWLALIAAILGIWMSLDGDFTTAARLAGPLAAAVLVAGLVFLAEWARLREPNAASPFAAMPGSGLRYAALALGTLAVAELGWALVDAPEHTTAWVVLHRTVLLMVSFATMTVVYGVFLVKRLPAIWGDSARRAGPILGVAAVAVLATIIAQEAWLYTGDDLAPPMALPAVLIVSVALAGLILASLTFAVAPGRDPLGLSERGRTMYVYAAEILLVVIFVHLRLTEPGLFQRGLLAQFWPFILMGVAFVGAFLSDYFARRGLRVLAEPLEHTGVFLPVLPMLAAWSVPTVNYAFVWFSAGLLYGLLSVRKHSFRFALLAALAGNAGLWVMLHQSHVDFLGHPQFWLIPLAVIVLVSEFYNRDRLSAAQSSTLRYLGLIVIYVSSTADMFIVGVGKSALYPLILALLAVLGILAGMVLQIRAFLLLGVSFLMLVLLSIIWHAGVDGGQTWILWSAGIALGIAILTLFGIFEKRRNDVLQVIENLKRWK